MRTSIQSHIRDPIALEQFFPGHEKPDTPWCKGLRAIARTRIRDNTYKHIAGQFTIDTTSLRSPVPPVDED
jgi:hypothetical protein